MELTPEQEQKFKFRARYEAEQAAAGANAGPGVTEDYTAGNVVKDLGREALKGGAGAVDFLTSAFGTQRPAADALTPEQRANMQPQDWANLSVSPAIPAIGKTEGFQDFTKRDVEQYPEMMEGLMTGANFAGSALVPFSPLTKAKHVKDLALSAGLFGGGAGAFDAFTDDTSDLGKVGAGLTSLVGVHGFKNLLQTGKLLGGPTKTEEAVKLIDDISTDAKALPDATTAAIARGDKGTLGQVTQDPQILALEKGAAREAEFSHTLGEINESIATKAAQDVDAVAPLGADPQAALTQAKAQVQQTADNIAASTKRKQKVAKDQAATKKRALGQSVAKEEAKIVKEADTVAAETARAAAELETLNLAALNKANPSAKPITETGEAGQKILGDNTTREYNAVWSQVDHIPVEAQQSVRQVAAKGDSTLATSTDKETLKNLMNTVDSVAHEPTAASVKALDTTLRNAAASAKTSNTALYTVIKDMRTALRDGLDPKFATRLKELDGFFGEYLTVRKGGAKADETGSVFTAEQLNKSDKVVAGEKRFAEGRGFMQSLAQPKLGSVKATTDKIAQSGKNVAASESKIKALQADTGKVTTDATATAEALRKTKVSRAKSIKEKSFAGQFASHDDAVNAVDKVFSNTKNPIKQTAELIKVAAKDATGKATKGLKSAYIKSLSKKIITGGKITNTAADKFKELKGPLSKLFKPDELASIETAIRDSHKIKMHSDVRAILPPEAGKGFKFILASLFGIKGATAVLSGNSLLIGRLGREASVKQFVGNPHKKVLAKMEEMLLNPEKYAEGVQKVKNSPTKKNIRNALIKWGLLIDAKTPDEE